MKLNNQFYMFTQDELKTISDRIKAKMEERNLSQSKLARESGLSRPQVNAMLNGYCPNGSNERQFRNPKPETLQKICKGLECDMEYLIGKIDHSTHDLQFICDYTGLSERAVEWLHYESENLNDSVITVNKLLENPETIEILTNYLFNAAVKQLSYSMAEMHITPKGVAVTKHADDLQGYFGNLIIDGEKIDSEFVKGVLISKLRKQLDEIQKSLSEKEGSGGFQLDIPIIET